VRRGAWTSPGVALGTDMSGLPTNAFGRIVCEVDLEPQQLAYIRQMMTRHQIPDVAKALRVLVNYAQANPEREDQIFKKVRCRHCI
jgi:hypothetical protein